MQEKQNRKTRFFEPKIIIKGEELRINAKKIYGVYPIIIEKMVEQLDICIEIHKRVFVVLFILQHRETSKGNKDISKFMNCQKQWIRRNYKTKNIGSVWVREWEKAKAKSHHYHCALFIDGDVIRHSQRILEVIRSKWFKYGNVPIKFLEHPYYNIDKHNHDEMRTQVIYRLSYYAKTRGKGYRNPQAKDYQTSRLKLNLITFRH